MSFFYGAVFFRSSADRALADRMMNACSEPSFTKHRRSLRAGEIFGTWFLPVLEEDVFDQQPRAALSDGSVLLFDGRIDNRSEIGRELNLEQSLLRELSDCCLLRRAFSVWGENTPRKLLGDFALAWWRPSIKQLLLARDPMGVRPLYWSKKNGVLAFSSSPRALFCLPGVSKELDREYLSDSINAVPFSSGRSYFKDLCTVRPGTTLLLEEHNSFSCRYFSPELIEPLTYAKDSDYVDHFREVLSRAVRRCSRTTGIVGAHLSAGFDSSAIVAYAAKEEQRKSRKVVAFTSVPRGDSEYPVPKGHFANEWPLARLVAMRYPNVVHVAIKPKAGAFLKALSSDPERLQRFVLNPSNQVWEHEILEQASERGCAVMLSGLMGNATISYTGWPLLNELFLAGRWIRWARECRYASARRKVPLKKLLAFSAGPILPDWVWGRVRGMVVGAADRLAWSPLFQDKKTLQSQKSRCRDRGLDFDGRPAKSGLDYRLAILSIADMGDFSRVGDIFGISYRYPLIDRELLEFCLATPSEQYLRKGEPKWLYKRAMSDELPAEVLNCRKKGYQAADWEEDIRESLPSLKSSLAEVKQSNAVQSLLDANELDELFQRFESEGTFRGDEAAAGKFLRGLTAANFACYTEGSNRRV